MKESQILIIEHAEGRASGMPELIQAVKATPTIIRTYRNEELPSVDKFDAVISGGGPMGAYEMNLPEYDFLKREADFISDMIAKGKAVLGICLGHQLLAHILGGTVQPSPKNAEVGWSKITINAAGKQDQLFANMPEEFWSFQYHNDYIHQLPASAIPLAWTPQCPIQAFRYSTQPIWGVQFHPEISAERAQRILTSRKDILEKEGVDIAVAMRQGLLVNHEPRKQIFYNFIRALR